jgi:hypothetical protein
MALSTVDDSVHTLYFMHTLLSTIRAYEMMTPETGVAIKPRMGRKLRWPERIMAKFAAGTLDRIAAVLVKGEVRLDFIRGAVDRELERREAGRKHKRKERRS